VSDPGLDEIRDRHAYDRRLVSHLLEPVVADTDPMTPGFAHVLHDRIVIRGSPASRVRQRRKVG
jgi:hypothetical protein